MQRRYSQNAKGTFCTYLRPNTPHCGPVTADHPLRQTFHYHVAIRYPKSAQLDEHGFLLDNTYFRDYFDCFGCCQIGISCEELADLMARQIAADAARFHPTVTVTLTPVAGVTMSATEKA